MIQIYFPWLTVIEWCFSRHRPDSYKTTRLILIRTDLDSDAIRMVAGWAMSLEPGGRMSQNYEFGSGNVYREKVQEKVLRNNQIVSSVTSGISWAFVRFLSPFCLTLTLTFLLTLSSIRARRTDQPSVRILIVRITETETSVMVLKYFRPGPEPNTNTWIDNKVRWWSVSHHKNHNNWPKTNHYHPVRIQNHSNNDENGYTGYHDISVGSYGRYEVVADGSKIRVQSLSMTTVLLRCQFYYFRWSRDGP